jgi:Fic family protein
LISKGLHVDIDVAMVRRLEKAAHAVGKLVGSTQLLPDPDRFVYMYLRLEALISSRIEGTQASLMDLLQFEQERADRHRTDDLVQVSNHLSLLRKLDKRKRGIPLRVGELNSLHAELLHETRGRRASGAPRRVQNWIGGDDIMAATFVPPPPSEVPAALGDLLGFVHRDESLPPLLLAAVAHAHFETIHPYVDGNGRLGRYLIHHIMWERRVVDRPVLYLSHYFRLRQGQYYDRLQATREVDDLEGWCGFFLDGVAQVAEEALDRAQRVILVRQEFEALVRDTMARRAASALVVLNQMYGQPIVDVRQVRVWTGLSPGAAHSLVAELANAKVLEELTGHRRNRRFALRRYLDLFTAIEAR